MPTYHYEAMDSKGQEVKDVIEALSNEEAISKIRNLGYFPTKIREKGSRRRAKSESAKAKGPQRPRGTGGKVKVKILTQFTRQLSTLQDAGLPILRSLRILEQQQKPGTLKNVCRAVGDDVESGATLSEAMARYPKTFNNLYTNMVSAGEAGGVLDLILNRLELFYWTLDNTPYHSRRIRLPRLYCAGKPCPPPPAPSPALRSAPAMPATVAAI